MFENFHKAMTFQMQTHLGQGPLFPPASDITTQSLKAGASRHCFFDLSAGAVIHRRKNPLQALLQAVVFLRVNLSKRVGGRLKIQGEQQRKKEKKTAFHTPIMTSFSLL